MPCPPRCIASANASRVSSSRASREIPRVFPETTRRFALPTAHQFPRAVPRPSSAPFGGRPYHGHRSRCSRAASRPDFTRLFFRRGSHALSNARITSNIPAVIDIGERPKCAKTLALATSIHVVLEREGGLGSAAMEITPGLICKHTFLAMRHFFVDEAGDLTLFDRRGRSMLGRDGVSQYFMVGVAEIRNPAVVGSRLDTLRRDLMSDPYLPGACSMHFERRKTALAFHAKDDLPEVRWRVYERLRRLDIKVAVALRRKVVLEAQARALFQKTGRKLRPDDVYDALVTQLFIGRFRDDAKNHLPSRPVRRHTETPRSRMPSSVRAWHKHAQRSAKWYRTGRLGRLGCK